MYFDEIEQKQIFREEDTTESAITVSYFYKKPIIGGYEKVLHNRHGASYIVRSYGLTITEEWTLNGIYHREEGPAMFRKKDGKTRKGWMQHGAWFRESGPVMVEHSYGMSHERWLEDNTDLTNRLISKHVTTEKVIEFWSCESGNFKLESEHLTEFTDFRDEHNMTIPLSDEELLLYKLRFQ